MRRHRRRHNPRGGGLDTGKLAMIGLGALALTSKGVRDQIGGFFGTLGANVHGQVAQAAPAAQGAIAAASGSTGGKVTPWSAAGLAAGRQLWADQHGGNATGFDAISADDKTTWSAQALHNQGLWP